VLGACVGVILASVLLPMFDMIKNDPALVKQIANGFNKKRRDNMSNGKKSVRNKGFTILEILVVISVIAILIGIAIPRFKGMQDAANAIKAKSELRSIQAAIESYISVYKVYLPR